MKSFREIYRALRSDQFDLRQAARLALTNLSDADFDHWRIYRRARDKAREALR